MLEAVRRVQAKAWVDRMEATVEAHILPAAKVREAAGIPGTTVQTAFLCRDKPAMKEALRQADVACAQSRGVASPQELRMFAAEVGFPIILKPRAGAGASGTQRVDNDRELESAIVDQGIDRGASVAAEEFIEGHEGFYDTISIGGKVVHEFISHYYPNVLEAMRTRWISPQICVTNRMDVPEYGQLKELGQKVIKALGIGTSATHMEWFFGPKGLKISEIGARPPGERIWDLYCVGNDLDLYAAWAKAVVWGRVDAVPSRRMATGSVQVRPERDGRISGYENLDEVLKRIRPWVFAKEVPAAGRETVAIEKGYLANAWFRLRHPDYDELCELMNWIGRTLKVRVR